MSMIKSDSLIKEIIKQKFEQMSNRNATASWSGYSHQGQVGILVALREMNRLINAGLQNEFAIHYLEYESHEDIAIYRDVNGNTPVYSSVHQVKAYYSNGHLINTYKDVFTGNPIYQKDAQGKFIKDANGHKMLTGSYELGQWCPGNNYLHSAVEIGNWVGGITYVQ